LRRFQRGENVEALWRADLQGMREGGVLMTHPGAKGSPAEIDDIDECRVAEAALLARGALARIMTELGLALHDNPRSPGWARMPHAIP